VLRLSAPAASTWARRASSIALYVASIVLGLIVWELAGRNVSRVVLAPPSLVAVKLWAGFASGALPAAFLRSLGHMVAGFAIALAVALPVGVLMGRMRAVAWLLDPLVAALYAIPPVAFVPFIIVWCGLFFEARVTLVAVMSVFEMLVTFAAGARAVPPGLVDVGRSFGARRGTLVVKVMLPAMLPFIITGLRLGLVRAVHGMIVAELFFAAVNLGDIMKRGQTRFDAAGVLAVVVLLAVFGLAAQETLRAVENRALLRNAGGRS
jgi:ABC-type nitrate/sulfonate/bicarbonate transport system permease component